jgi:hypothetical protein
MKKLLVVVLILVASITTAQQAAIDSTKSETSQLPEVSVAQDKFNEVEGDEGAGVILGTTIAFTGMILIASGASRPKVSSTGPFGYVTVKTTSFDAIGQILLGVLLTPVGIAIGIISSPKAKKRREQRRLRRYQVQRALYQLQN